MWRKLNKLHIIIGTICLDKKSWGQRQQNNQALQAMMNNIYYMQIWLCYPSSQGESADVKRFWSAGTPYNDLNASGGSSRKRYLFQASGIWKGRDFTCEVYGRVEKSFRSVKGLKKANRYVFIAERRSRNVLVLWFYSSQHLQQLKGM